MSVQFRMVVACTRTGENICGAKRVWLDVPVDAVHGASRLGPACDEQCHGGEDDGYDDESWLVYPEGRVSQCNVANGSSSVCGDHSGQYRRRFRPSGSECDACSADGEYDGG